MPCLPGLSVSVVFSGISALRCAELEYEKEQHKLRARSLQVSEYRAQARVCETKFATPLYVPAHFHLLTRRAPIRPAAVTSALLIEYDLPLLLTCLLTYVCDTFPLAYVSMAVGRTHFYLLTNLLAAAQARADGRRPYSLTNLITNVLLK